MEPLHSELRLAAPRSIVWETLADLEGVNRWNPTIARAECVGDRRRGLGARRRCWMHPSGWMTETVTEWEPEGLIGFTIDEASPLKRGFGRFCLDDLGPETRLVADFDYEVRFGPLGPVIDRLVVHRQLSAGWRAAMDGLRRHVEQLASA